MHAVQSADRDLLLEVALVALAPVLVDALPPLLCAVPPRRLVDKGRRRGREHHIARRRRWHERSAVGKQGVWPKGEDGVVTGVDLMAVHAVTIASRPVMVLMIHDRCLRCAASIYLSLTQVYWVGFI